MLKGPAQSSEQHSGSRVDVSGRLLDATEIDLIRSAARERQSRVGGIETVEGAELRGQIDRALCSVVLEAGLLCEQAAALEWRDLGADASKSPTLTIRTASSGGPTGLLRSLRMRMTISLPLRLRSPVRTGGSSRSVGSRSLLESDWRRKLQDWKSGVFNTEPRRRVRAGTTDNDSEAVSVRGLRLASVFNLVQ